MVINCHLGPSSFLLCFSLSASQMIMRWEQVARQLNSVMPCRPKKVWNKTTLVLGWVCTFWSWSLVYSSKIIAVMKTIMDLSFWAPDRNDFCSQCCPNMLPWKWRRTSTPRRKTWCSTRSISRNMTTSGNMCFGYMYLWLWVTVKTVN